MTFEEFVVFQEDLFKQSKEMASTKGKEYANGEDRFGNFKRLSAELGISPATVGWIYLTKHLDSIKCRIRTGETYSNEAFLGRVVDAITYLTLIAGMIEEELIETDKASQKLTENDSLNSTIYSYLATRCQYRKGLIQCLLNLGHSGEHSMRDNFVVEAPQCDFKTPLNNQCSRELGHEGHHHL